MLQRGIHGEPELPAHISAHLFRTRLLEGGSQEASYTGKPHFMRRLSQHALAGARAYRITSSAWKRRIEGTVKPSAWAVLRLMTSLNFRGCSTGRSAGLAPLRILST
jgi:hypothetical protein